MKFFPVMVSTALAVGTAVGAFATPDAWSHDDHDNGHSQALHEKMMQGMDAAMKMPMSGDLDRDFAAMMISHHKQAIEMADVELTNGKNPELKAMARRMEEQQKKEIEELQQFAKH